MQILLGPTNDGHSDITRAFGRALKSSKEVYIASAFLTNWSISDRLSSRCHKFLFLVGTDFGLTRKLACENVLKWLPKKFKSDFLAVPISSYGSFHPKVIVWQDLNNCYHSIIGSSNLTEAAFSSNFEANVKLELPRRGYDRIVQWIENIANDSQVINADWLAQYKERDLTHPPGVLQRKISRVIEITIPTEGMYKEAILGRRRQQKKFEEIHRKLLISMKKCADGFISNTEFWESFKKLWWNHESRFQGSGIQFKCKVANWKQACKAVLNILNQAKAKNVVSLDRIVKQEINSLFEKGNPARGAWLSEMLCHYLPDSYPLLNKPVKEWLKHKRWNAQRGSSKGSAYIELSRKLRDIVRQNKSGPHNLAELDAVIWMSVTMERVDKIIDDIKIPEVKGEFKKVIKNLQKIKGIGFFPYRHKSKSYNWICCDYTNRNRETDELCHFGISRKYFKCQTWDKKLGDWKTPLRLATYSQWVKECREDIVSWAN